MPFQAGNMANPRGRPKGKPNRITREVRAMAQSLFDREYWLAAKKRLRAGTENPAIHALLLSYAYGKPRAEEENKGTQVTIGALSLLHTSPGTPAIAAL